MVFWGEGEVPLVVLLFLYCCKVLVLDISWLIGMWYLFILCIYCCVPFLDSNLTFVSLASFFLISVVRNLPLCWHSPKIKPVYLFILFPVFKEILIFSCSNKSICGCLFSFEDSSHRSPYFGVVGSFLFLSN